MDNPPHQVPPEIIARLRWYFFIVVAFSIVTLCLGVVAIVGPIVLAAFPEILTFGVAGRILACASSVATIMLIAFGLPGKTRGAIQAWRHLQFACIDFRLGHITDTSALMTSLREAESILAKRGYFASANVLKETRPK